MGSECSSDFFSGPCTYLYKGKISLDSDNDFFFYPFSDSDNNRRCVSHFADGFDVGSNHVLLLLCFSSANSICRQILHNQSDYRNDCFDNDEKNRGCIYGHCIVYVRMDV